ncbi:MAG TPA: hypothetical protein VGB24_00570 [Longimicrobium sp.]|jgi:hypothetical protein|uniref:hypothetical protein n=1 Tax=Longimicrobium sp. TaxID=2029185 RepID=UPI002ED917F6
MSRTEPSGPFHATAALDKGTLPGEDPKTIHKHFEAGLARLSGGSSAFLMVQETGNYVNIDDSGWARIEDSARTKYVLVPYYNDHYIVVANGTWKGYYLSYNGNSYVGVYSRWSDARYWAVEPLNCSPYPGMYSYSRSGVAYLCCNGVEDSIDNLIQIFTA